MSINIVRPLRQINRFGMLARYIDAHLDDDLTLARLADVARLSRHRLDGGFQAYAHETPMARVWRLRLLRARQQITTMPGRSLLDIAIDAGYGSAQAFSRAFRRLHDKTPAAVRHEALPLRPSLRVEFVPEMPIQYVPFSGERSDLQYAANELRARAMACGVERHRRFGWAVNVEKNLYGSASTHIDIEAALLHAPLGQRIGGLDRGTMGGGTYAVFRFQGNMALPAASDLIARIESETGWHAVEGPWLRRCRNVQHLPSLLDRCFELYVPVSTRYSDTGVQARKFNLER